MVLTCCLLRPSVFSMDRWARLSKLFILVAVIVGVIVLTDLDVLESIRQVNCKRLPTHSLRLSTMLSRTGRLSATLSTAVFAPPYHFILFFTCSRFPLVRSPPPSLRLSPRQFIFYILSFVILIYYVSQIVVLFMENALRDVALVNLAFKSVHLITGIVIIAPVLLLSFFPLFVDLQTRMLFNEDFSQRYACVFGHTSRLPTGLGISEKRVVQNVLRSHVSDVV